MESLTRTHACTRTHTGLQTDAPIGTQASGPAGSRAHAQPPSCSLDPDGQDLNVAPVPWKGGARCTPLGRPLI